MPRPRGRPRYPDLLTPAEWRIVDAIRHGMSNRQIARRRGVSLDAVKFHVSNAVAKLALEGRDGLKQWRGVPRGSALQRRDQSMNGVSGLGAIGQISRSVSDIEASEAWYRDVLGLPHLYTFGKLSFFDCGGTSLFLSQERAEAAAESILYFRVGDIQSAYDDLRSRGVRFTDAPHMIHRHEDGTEEWMAFFEDLEGRPLAIMCQARPAAGS